MRSAMKCDQIKSTICLISSESMYHTGGSDFVIIFSLKLL